MALEAESARNEFKDVVAPSKLFDPVSTVLDGLGRRVLWESARVAKARVGKNNTCTINRDDVLQAVRAVLEHAAADIEEALGDDEFRSVRHAS